MAQAILTYAVGTFVALFPIANPIGAVPVFYSLTETDSRAEHRQQAQRTALNVVFALGTVSNCSTWFDQHSGQFQAAMMP